MTRPSLLGLALPRVRPRESHRQRWLEGAFNLGQELGHLVLIATTMSVTENSCLKKKSKDGRRDEASLDFVIVITFITFVCFFPI